MRVNSERTTAEPGLLPTVTGDDKSLSATRIERSNRGRNGKRSGGASDVLRAADEYLAGRVKRGEISSLTRRNHYRALVSFARSYWRSRSHRCPKAISCGTRSAARRDKRPPHRERNRCGGLVVWLRPCRAGGRLQPELRGRRGDRDLPGVDAVQRRRRRRQPPPVDAWCDVELVSGPGHHDVRCARRLRTSTGGAVDP